MQLYKWNEIGKKEKRKGKEKEKNEKNRKGKDEGEGIFETNKERNFPKRKGKERREEKRREEKEGRKRTEQKSKVRIVSKNFSSLKFSKKGVIEAKKRKKGRPRKRMKKAQDRWESIQTQKHQIFKERWVEIQQKRGEIEIHIVIKWERDRQTDRYQSWGEEKNLSRWNKPREGQNPRDGKIETQSPEWRKQKPRK